MTIDQFNKRFARCLAISPYAIFIQAHADSERCANHQCPNAQSCKYYISEQENAMKVYTTINQVYVENTGWVKPDTLDNFNEVRTINYNYVEFVGSPDGWSVTTQTGQEDVPIERSRECLYADGCRIHRSTFFKK